MRRRLWLVLTHDAGLSVANVLGGVRRGEGTLVYSSYSKWHLADLPSVSIYLPRSHLQMNALLAQSRSNLSDIVRNSTMFPPIHNLSIPDSIVSGSIRVCRHWSALFLSPFCWFRKARLCYEAGTQPVAYLISEPKKVQSRTNESRAIAFDLPASVSVIHMNAFLVNHRYSWLLLNN
jgi:hypothetical protein